MVTGSKGENTQERNDTYKPKGHNTLITRMNHVKKSQEEQEEVDMAKLQLHLRELEVKATFETTETEKRRMAAQLSLLKRENRELQSVLDQQKKGHQADSGGFQRKQQSLVHTKLHALRREHHLLEAPPTTRRQRRSCR